MDLQLVDKHAVITGSTAGIGFAIAEALAKEGASVVVNGRTEQRVQEAINKLRGTGVRGKLDGIAADVGTAEGTDKLTHRFPDADILVNNAGIFAVKPFDQIDDDEWKRFFEVNVLSGVRLSRHYLPRMIKRNWGRVVFISSESALQIPPEMIHYGMTKTAQLAVSRGLAETTARNLFTLMAYKDEYEVARLYTDGAFLQKLQRQFDGDFTLDYHLAPPLLARRDPATGAPKKRAFGPWMRHVFTLLTWLRPLRGTALDIFGYTRERRMERHLIADYEALIRELSASLNPGNHALAIEIASLPAKMRGFGHIKARNVESAKACEAELLAMLRNKDSQLSAA